MTTILVIDDEPQMVDALEGFLEAEGHDVVTGATGWRGVELTAETRPDLVILDLRLPDIDGVEVVRRIRTFHPHPVLILSGSDSETHKVAALDAGADDFLHKPFGVRELHARVRALLRRPHAMPDRPVLEYGDLVIDVAAHEVRVAGVRCPVTPTEWRLLEALLSNPGALISHRQLFHQVWDQGYGDESRQALRTHVRALRRKLGDDATDPQYIRTETGAGYRWLPDGRAMPPGREPRPGPELAEPVDAVGTGDGRPTRDVVHDLNNVLTAMRIVVYLAGSRSETDAGRTGSPVGHDACSRLEQLVTRAIGLAAELADRQLEAGPDRATLRKVEQA